MDFKNYFEELKRRKVIKTAVAYVAAAWIIAQATADVLPIFEIPSSVQQSIIMILIVGFPAILVLSWMYDITPEGIKKTAKAKNEMPEGIRKTWRLNAVIISLLSAIVVIVLYGQVSTPEGGPEAEQMTGMYADNIPNTIAVLPFKNWSGDEGLEYVSDGIADEITTNLQGLREYKVVAFREAIKFKYSDIGLKQIADSLDVRFILDGSMQLSGERIRVKVQLLDGRTNEYFWAEDFTTAWDAQELFSLQSEVTRKVLEKLEKGVGEKQVLIEEGLPTDNTEAYNYYLKGMYQGRKGSQQGIGRAIQFFEKAIELDSSYIEAYKELAYYYMSSGLQEGVNDQQEAWQQSKKYVRKVLELSKDKSDLRWAMHRMRFNSYVYEWDFELIEKHYLAGFDDNSTLFKTAYELNTGRFEEALQTARLRAEQYPTSGACQVYMANALYFAGKFKEAKSVLDQNFELYNDDHHFVKWAASLYYYLGDFNRSQEALRRMKFTFNDTSANTLFLTAVNHEVNGDSSAEEATVQTLLEMYQNNHSGSPAWYLAKYYAHIGDYEASIAWLQRSFDRRDVEMIWLRTEPLFAAIREDQRYLEIYKNVGFPIPPATLPEGVARTIQ
jgi:TolB-like protein/Tfp pilus assembly protein PilF